MLLFGMVTLLPWNIFINATDVTKKSNIKITLPSFNYFC
jgi:hypothetical protein